MAEKGVPHLTGVSQMAWIHRLLLPNPGPMQEPSLCGVGANASWTWYVQENYHSTTRSLAVGAAQYEVPLNAMISRVFLLIPFVVHHVSFNEISPFD
jgi:hypothetical protein